MLSHVLNNAQLPLVTPRFEGDKCGQLEAPAAPPKVKRNRKAKRYAHHHTAMSPTVVIVTLRESVCNAGSRAGQTVWFVASAAGWRVWMKTALLPTTAKGSPRNEAMPRSCH